MNGDVFHQRWFAVAAAAGVFLAGAAATVLPTLIGLGLAACVGIYLLTRPVGRLAWFTLGALLVFQSSQGLTPPKLIYLAGVILSVLLALPRMRGVLAQPWGARFKPAVLGAGFLAGWVVLVTSVHSLAIIGVPVQSWGRDALTHLLIAAAVVLGIEAAATVSVRQARLATAVVGAMAAVGFAVAWVGRRGVGLGIELEQGFLASLVILTVPLALAMTLAMVGRGFRLQWLLYGAAIVSAVLLTGTRTGLVLGLVVLGVVGARRKCRVPPVKTIAGGLAAGVAVAVALPVLGDRFTTQGFREGRFEAATRVITDGFAQDQSGVIRARAYEYGQQIAADHLLLGQGLGVVLPNPNPGGAPAGFSIDTPWLYPAKFGLLGTVVVVVALAMIAVACAQRGEGWMPELTVTRGALVAWVAILPFGPTTEDKGFALAVALLVMLVGSAGRAANGPGGDHRGASVERVGQLEGGSERHRPAAADMDDEPRITGPTS